MKKKESTNKKAMYAVLKAYWGQCKKQPLHTIVGMFSPAVGSILIFFIPPLIVARLVDIYTETKSISQDALIQNALLFGGSWLAGELLWRLGMNSMIKLQGNSMGELYKKSLNQLFSKEYGFYSDNFVGSLTKKAAAYAFNFESFTNTIYWSLSSNIFPIIFATIVLWGYSPIISLTLLGFMIIAVCIAIPLIRRRSKLVAIRHESSSRMSGRISDTMTNIQTIKAFASEAIEEKMFSEAIEDHNKKWQAAANYHNRRLDMIFSPLYVITNVIGLVMAIYFAQNMDLAPGVIVIIYSYYSQITRIVWVINYVYRDIENSVTQAMEFTEMFLEEPTIKDSVNASPLLVKDGSIEFKDVSFGYEESAEKKETFLQDFNLVIPKNQKVGLVGPSGGGKTTITKLLLRFIDIHEGSITIDGQPIADVTQESLRKAIAYVPQEPLLFHRSLFENIAYGMEGASRDDVYRAAKLARADEFIDKLPEGYETQVGERGIKLSGGQRQRIAIARAILKHSSILVLDEATSALDSESEKYIQEGLVELMKDKTTLVIAHRLSTIKHLDRIIVLDNGKILEDGTHAELIKQNGMYAKLWGHQSGEFI